MGEQVISAERIPQRLELAPLLGPLTIMVPDFADPCGLRKVARTVDGAYPADVCDVANGRYTRGRWQISFAGAYLHPMIMVTSGEHRYAVASADPADGGGPCELCRAHMQHEASQRVERAAGRDAAARAQRVFEADATHAGYDRGYDHASFMDAYGHRHRRVPSSVPQRYASVATFYLAGCDDGMQAYTDDEQ